MPRVIVCDVNETLLDVTSGDAQLRHAGLLDSFERVFSVESVPRFKPAPKSYAFVAATLGVETGIVDAETRAADVS